MLRLRATKEVAIFTGAEAEFVLGFNGTPLGLDPNATPIIKAPAVMANVEVPGRNVCLGSKGK